MDLSLFIMPFAVAVLSGGLCAYLGNFVLMRNMTFVSIALSQSAALGVAAGFFLGIYPELGALLTAGLAALYFWRGIHTASGQWHESGIGVIYVACAAAAIILISKNPMFESHGMDIVNGNLLYSTPADIMLLMAAVVFLLLIHVLFFRHFVFMAFDMESARAFGLKTGSLDLSFMLSLALGVALSMKVAGVLFVFASIILPPLICLSIFRSVKTILFVSPLVVMFCAAAGLYLSFRFDLPASPAIIGCYVALLAVVSLGKRTLRRAN